MELTLDDRLEIARYQAFRLCRRLRDEDCRKRDAKRFLTRVMRRLQYPAEQERDALPCENACGYEEPYGFVPECGCPIHDPDDARAAAPTQSGPVEL
jgi:hypothetical protein